MYTHVRLYYHMKRSSCGYWYIVSVDSDSLEQALGKWSIEHNVLWYFAEDIKDKPSNFATRSQNSLWKRRLTFPSSGGEYCHTGFEKGLSSLINNQVLTSLGK